ANKEVCMQRALVWLPTLLVLALAAGVAAPPATRQDNSMLEALKGEATAEVERMKQFTQQIVDQVFSYGELGFQEFETSRYLIGILKKNGFMVQEGIAGIPTAWLASWGSG